MMIRLLLLMLVCSCASAQLVPDHLYYGVNRRMPMQVTLPDDGTASIRLFKAGEDAPFSEAAVEAGGVDLAGLFPVLWTRTAPEVVYAQLFLGEKGIGSPVVLQPLLTPLAASLDNQRNVTWPTAGRPRVFSGMRAYPERLVRWETSMGTIDFRLRADAAPNLAWNFQHLAEGGFYTEIIFHRIIGSRGGRDPFVAQVGDPTGTGSGGPGYMVDIERSTLPHDFGVLSMARSMDPNSNGSQVFICLSRNGTSFLDGNYAPFAEAVSGAEIIEAMGKVPTGAGDRPTEPPVLESASVIDAPPFPDRPARVERPESDGR